MVLRADFNDTPSSGLYSFMSRGRVHESLLNRRKPSSAHNKSVDRVHPGAGTSLLTIPTEDSGSGRHLINPLPHLVSAYAEWHPSLVGASPGEPNFTTFLKCGTKACIDYIFFDSRSLVAVCRYELMPREFLEPAGLPSAIVPSDHMALVVELSWIQPKILPGSHSQASGVSSSESPGKKHRIEAASSRF